MDKSSVVLLLSVWLMAGAMGVFLYQILVKRRSPELVFLVWALFLGVVLAVVLPMIGPGSAGPELREMGGTVVGALLLGGAVRLVNHLRQRGKRPIAGCPDDPPAES